MKALNEHLAYRDDFRNGAEDTDFEGDDQELEESEDAESERDEESVVVPVPAPKKVKKAKQPPVPRASPPPASDEPPHDPGSWFGPWWDKRDELAPMMRETLTSFKPVQIRNFLNKDMALALHKEIYDSPHYEVYEQYNRWYQFHFKAIYQHNKNYNDNLYLSAISGVMDLPEIKTWIADISGSDVNGTTLAGASYYAANDYTMPHTDRGDNLCIHVCAILSS
jgi:hypothetical protein